MLRDLLLCFYFGLTLKTSLNLSLTDQLTPSDISPEPQPRAPNAEMDEEQIYHVPLSNQLATTEESTETRPEATRSEVAVEQDGHSDLDMLANTDRSQIPHLRAFRVEREGKEKGDHMPESELLTSVKLTTGQHAEASRAKLDEEQRDPISRPGMLTTTAEPQNCHPRASMAEMGDHMSGSKHLASTEKSKELHIEEYRTEMDTEQLVNVPGLKQIQTNIESPILEAFRAMVDREQNEHMLESTQLTTTKEWPELHLRLSRTEVDANRGDHTLHLEQLTITELSLKPDPRVFKAEGDLSDHQAFKAEGELSDQDKLILADESSEPYPEAPAAETSVLGISAGEKEESPLMIYNTEDDEDGLMPGILGLYTKGQHNLTFNNQPETEPNTNEDLNFGLLGVYTRNC